ncbi:MAG: imidazole glycerol phosphate synthase subunit HisH [Leptospiraceae bacterium]|nr:imidazole glycerol phosphate synthase subunit HisH [Leptospiraceae bacterium]
MIAVIDFGMGNIHSCLKAISQFTSNYKLISKPEELDSASAIILPGDGAFEKAMSNLNSQGMIDPIKKKVEAGTPLFGICIGFQLLFQDSQESSTPGRLVEGFGFLKGNIKKFNGKKMHKVPHMGWNKLILNKRKENRILDGIKDNEYMYFIHSFRPVDTSTKYECATCSYYDEKFPVVVEKDNIFGTQFHPEKSHNEGLKILKNFIKLVDL